MHTTLRKSALVGVIGASALMLAACTPPASSTGAASMSGASPAASAAVDAKKTQALQLLAEAKRDMNAGRPTDANQDLDGADAIFRSNPAYTPLLQRTANARGYMATSDVNSAGHEIDGAADQLQSRFAR